MTRAKFAKDTTVPVERSESEIKLILKKYGATDVVSGQIGNHTIIGCRFLGRLLRIETPLPSYEEFFENAAPGWHRNPAHSKKAYEQEIMRLWRAHALVIKAKMEMVSNRIELFEREFLAYIVTPGGMTVYEQLASQIESAYKDGKALPLLLSGPRE